MESFATPPEVLLFFSLAPQIGSPCLPGIARQGKQSQAIRQYLQVRQRQSGARRALRSCSTPPETC
jgi:hypothetical protein